MKPEVETNILDWSSSVYLISVFPGVRSIASPPAALDTWKAMSETIPSVPLTEVLRITEPLSSMLPRVSDNPAWMVSLALSLEKRPVERAAKANTEETTTKAIKTMAVSRPVMPRWPDRR